MVQMMGQQVASNVRCPNLMYAVLKHPSTTEICNLQERLVSSTQSLDTESRRFIQT